MGAVAVPPADYDGCHAARDVPLEYNGQKAWVRNYRDGRYQLLLDGDDMSAGSEEGEWVDCTTSDIARDPELPAGRCGEVIRIYVLRVTCLLLLVANSCCVFLASFVTYRVLLLTCHVLLIACYISRVACYLLLVTCC